MFNPDTNQVVLSRDVKWADWTSTDPSDTMKLFLQKEGRKDQTLAGIDDIDDDVDEDEEAFSKPRATLIPAEPEEVEPNEDSHDAVTGRKDRDSGSSESRAVTRSVTRSQTARASAQEATVIEAPVAVEEDDAALQPGEAEMVFTAELNSDPGEPKTLNEALTGPDSEAWRVSIGAEIMNFLSRKAWKRVPMQQLRDEGRKPIATKTIFKCKDEQDGSIRRKTRIVTKGFMQIPGVDYTESFSPVATDASVRTVIGISLYYIGHEKALYDINDKWVMEVFDVEAAFLNATMGEEKVYISTPEAMCYKKDVEKFMNDFEKDLKIERLGSLKKHLRVWWEWLVDDQGESYLKDTMPKMIREMNKAFQVARGKPARKAATPRFPRKMLRKSEEGIEPSMITEYRSIVGNILYYTTKVGQDMENGARELSWNMSNPNEEHWKVIEQCVGCLAGMLKDQGVIFRKPRELRLISYGDSDYVKCEDTRRSISGRVNTLGGMITNWSSKKQASVALSSMESECNTYAECYLEGMIVSMLLEEQREKREVEPCLVRSEDNYWDGNTKNKPEALFNEHATKLKNGNNMKCRREDVKV
jgi:hypothetical protein